MHWFNHQTHHRRQMHGCLTRLGVEEPAPLDLLVMRREQARAPLVMRRTGIQEVHTASMWTHQLHRGERYVTKLPVPSSIPTTAIRLFPAKAEVAPPPARSPPPHSQTLAEQLSRPPPASTARKNRQMSGFNLNHAVLLVGADPTVPVLADVAGVAEHPARNREPDAPQTPDPRPCPRAARAASAGLGARPVFSRAPARGDRPPHGFVRPHLHRSPVRACGAEPMSRAGAGQRKSRPCGTAPQCRTDTHPRGPRRTPARLSGPPP